MWYWSQSQGALSRNGKQVGTGYSGNATGKNNPAMQGAKGVGPIPRGQWRILGPQNSPSTGPYTLTVHAVDTTPNDDFEDSTGRGAFRIHGDSVSHPGDASHGCIILPRAIRELIWNSGDRDLMVIA